MPDVSRQLDERAPNDEQIESTARKLGVSVDAVRSAAGEADPDPNWENGEWILRQLKKGLIDVTVDKENDQLQILSSVKNVLTGFMKAKKNRVLTGPEADLNQYKTFDQLNDKIRSLPDTAFMDVSKRQLRGKRKTKKKITDPFIVPGSDLLFEIPHYRVYYATTMEALTMHGEGTDWCTRTYEGEYQVEALKRYGEMFIVYTYLPGIPNDEVPAVPLDHSSFQYQMPGWKRVLQFDEEFEQSRDVLDSVPTDFFWHGLDPEGDLQDALENLFPQFTTEEHGMGDDDDEEEEEFENMTVAELEDRIAIRWGDDHLERIKWAFQDFEDDNEVLRPPVIIPGGEGTVVREYAVALRFEARTDTVHLAVLPFSLKLRGATLLEYANITAYRGRYWSDIETNKITIRDWPETLGEHNDGLAVSFDATYGAWSTMVWLEEKRGRILDRDTYNSVLMRDALEQWKYVKGPGGSFFIALGNAVKKWGLSPDELKFVQARFLGLLLKDPNSLWWLAERAGSILGVEFPQIKDNGKHVEFEDDWDTLASAIDLRTLWQAVSPETYTNHGGDLNSYMADASNTAERPEGRKAADTAESVTEARVECAWCGKYLGDKEIKGDGISHGMCPDCAERMIQGDKFDRETGEWVPNKKTESVVEQDDRVYSRQDAGPEKLVHDDRWRDGDFLRKRLENAGDILRELAKIGGPPAWEYVAEKLRQIQFMLDDTNKVLDDLLAKARSPENKGVLDDLHKSYMDMLTSSLRLTQEQETAIWLVLHLAEGQWDKARASVRRIQDYKDHVLQIRREWFGSSHGPNESAEPEGIEFRVAASYVSPRERELTAEEDWVRKIAYALKDGNGLAIAEASLRMEELVPAGAVLVPVPNSSGDTSANRKLADVLAAVTGGQVADVLGRNVNVQSSTSRRKSGVPGLPRDAQARSMELSGVLPEGQVVLIDNVITTGATMLGTWDALGRPAGAIGLAYARAKEVLGRAITEAVPPMNVEERGQSKGIQKYVLEMIDELASKKYDRFKYWQGYSSIHPSSDMSGKPFNYQLVLSPHLIDPNYKDKPTTIYGYANWWSPSTQHHKPEEYDARIVINVIVNPDEWRANGKKRVRRERMRQMIASSFYHEMGHLKRIMASKESGGMGGDLPVAYKPPGGYEQEPRRKKFKWGVDYTRNPSEWDANFTSMVGIWNELPPGEKAKINSVEALARRVYGGDELKIQNRLKALGADSPKWRKRTLSRLNREGIPIRRWGRPQKESIDELAMPTTTQSGQHFYHATSSEEAGKKILADGFIKVADARRGHAAPRAGYAYISPSLKDAAIYALGGVFMGHEPSMKDYRGRSDKYGYIFEVLGTDLVDVDPDEDLVGDMVSMAYRDPTYSFSGWLMDLANQYASPNSLDKAINGEVIHQARVGKQLLKHMTDEQKHELMAYVPTKHEQFPPTVTLAHKGELPITRAWRLDRSRSKEINSDGSNLLDIAELVVDRSGVAESFDYEIAGQPSNTDSIAATFNDYRVEPGIQLIPIGEFDASFKYNYAAADDRARIDELKIAITKSGQVEPLIAVKDDEGYYILEGGHRMVALYELGAEALPAMVVVDLDKPSVNETVDYRQLRPTGDLLADLISFHELEYKYSRLAKEGSPEARSMREGMGRLVVAFAMKIAETVLPVFDDWVASHDTSNPMNFAKARLGMYADLHDQAIEDELDSDVDPSFFSWVLERSSVENAIDSYFHHGEGESIEKTMPETYRILRKSYEKKMSRESTRSRMPDTFEEWLEYLASYMNTIPEIMEAVYSEASEFRNTWKWEQWRDETILREIFSVAFLGGYEMNNRRRLGPAVQRVVKARDDLRRIAHGRLTPEQASRMLTLAINTAHQNGSMTQHLAREFGLNRFKLNQLSNRLPTKQWDTELFQSGVWTPFGSDEFAQQAWARKAAGERGVDEDAVDQDSRYEFPDESIESVARRVRSRMEDSGKCSSRASCALWSTELANELRSIGYDAKVAQGIFWVHDVADRTVGYDLDDWCEHQWIMVGDTIVDITTDQFNEGWDADAEFPPIIIAKMGTTRHDWADDEPIFYEAAGERGDSVNEQVSSGEWWIDDFGIAEFADGDIGDTNHSIQAFEAMVGFSLMDSDVPEMIPLEPLSQEAVKYLKDYGVEDDVIAYLQDGGDPREWAIQHRGWIRLAGGAAELWELDNGTLDVLRSGLFDAWGLDSADEDDWDTDVQIEEAKTRTLIDVPLRALMDDCYDAESLRRLGAAGRPTQAKSGEFLQTAWARKAAGERGVEESVTESWLKKGWVKPDGTFIPSEGGYSTQHRHVAAKALKVRDPMQAFKSALGQGWVRVGDATIQLPTPTDSAFLLARDHVRETSPHGEEWNIRIEWSDLKTEAVTSYRVPISEFKEMEGIGDLARYSKEVYEAVGERVVEESISEASGTVGWYNPKTGEEVRSRSSSKDNDHFAMIAADQEKFSVDLNDTRGWEDAINKAVANGWVRVNFYRGTLFVQASDKISASETARYYSEWPIDELVVDLPGSSQSITGSVLRWWLRESEEVPYFGRYAEGPVIGEGLTKKDARKLASWWNANHPAQHFVGLDRNLPKHWKARYYVWRQEVPDVKEATRRKPRYIDPEVALIQKFGTTDRPDNALYILSDGTYVDAGPKPRSRDHREINAAFYDDNFEKLIVNVPKKVWKNYHERSQWYLVKWFMETTNAIRAHPETGALYICKPPTGAQYRAIREWADWFTNDAAPLSGTGVIIEYDPTCGDRGPGYFYQEFQAGESPERIVRVLELKIAGLSQEEIDESVEDDSTRELARRGFRRADPVGKRVGPAVYTHRYYENKIVPEDVLEKARFILARDYPDHESGYNAIKFDTKSNAVTFQWSPDFDDADEPTVGLSVKVSPDGTISTTPMKDDPQIWHHKWMWVADDYPGFDVEASKRRSLQWLPHVKKGESSRIGTKSYWDNEVQPRWHKIGESDNEVITEEVQALRQYLKPEYYVIDLGWAGYFHVYYVLDIERAFGMDNFKEYMERYGRSNEEWWRITHKHHYKTTSGNRKWSDSKLPDFIVDSGVLDGLRGTMGMANEVSMDIGRLGFPRVRVVMILTTLSAESNWITGEPNLAGKWERGKHAMTLTSVGHNRAMNHEGSWIHEWAHAAWEQLPKNAKEYFIAWYKRNIQGAVQKHYSAGLSKAELDDFIDDVQFELDHEIAKRFPDDGFVSLGQMGKEPDKYRNWLTNSRNIERALSTVIFSEKGVGKGLRHHQTLANRGTHTNWIWGKFPPYEPGPIDHLANEFAKEMSTYKAEDVDEPDRYLYRLVRKLLHKYADLSQSSERAAAAYTDDPALDRPERGELRKTAQVLGKAPSAYATANPKELWAETVEHAVDSYKRGDLSEELWQLLKKMMHGVGPNESVLERIDLTPDEIEATNKTCRTSSAGSTWGNNSRVHAFVRDNIPPELAGHMLDFGAGNPPTHTDALRADGYDVDAYDHGDNADPDLHVTDLDGDYDTVIASKVLNVQPNPEALDATIQQLRIAAGDDGVVVANYPEPHKVMDGNEPLEIADVEEALGQHFDWVERVSGDIFMTAAKEPEGEMAAIAESIIESDTSMISDQDGQFVARGA